MVNKWGQSAGIGARRRGFVNSESIAATFWPEWGCLAGPLARFLASWTHLCHQPLAAEVNVGQRQRSERPCGVLLQAAVTHLAKSPKAFDHAKDMLHP